MADAAAPLDVGHLDGDHAGARHRQVHPVLEMPDRGRAVIGRILAHGGNGDAVGKVELAEGNRRKQVGGHGDSEGWERRM